MKRFVFAAIAAAFALPAVQGTPVPSTPLLGDVDASGEPDIAQWKVATVTLDRCAALEFLSYCAGRDPLDRGVIAGADLSYWITAMRFAGALVARQQFLPALDREDTGHYARWHAACLGRDDDRRLALTAAMPPSARALTPDLAAGSLLTAFVDTAIDEIVRTSSIPTRAAFGGASLHDRWLHALHSRTAVLEGTASEISGLDRQIREWRRPIHISAEAPFRLCFRLEEPGPDDSEAWNVRYLLQA